MASLTELNGRSSTSISVIDYRPATVNFDRLYSSNQPVTFTTTSLSVPNGIEITEFVNYEISDCHIKFSIVGIPGASLSWAAVPFGITLVEDSQTYTLSGFSTPQQWDIIKNPTWTVPVDFYTYTPWYIKVEIYYYDQEFNSTRTMEYFIYDPRYFYEVWLKPTAELVCDNTKVKKFDIALEVVAGCRFTYDVDMSLSFTMSVTPYEVEFSTGSWNSTTALSANVNNLQAITNYDIPRNYIANKYNLIFATNTPQITDPRSGNYTLTFTCASGQFSNNSLTSSQTTLTLTGTKSTINSAIANVYFWPNAMVTSNLTVVMTLTREGVTTASRNIPVYYQSNNSEIIRYTYTTAGNFTKTFSYYEKKYMNIAAILVGGGGSANSLSGGNASLPTVVGITHSPSSLSGIVGSGGQTTSLYNADGAGNPRSSAGGTAPSASDQSTYSVTYSNGSQIKTAVIWLKGWGGKNCVGGYETSGINARTGYSWNIRENINYSTYTKYFYRSEKAGSGGVAYDFWGDGVTFGRGGNGVMSLQGNPVTFTSYSDAHFWSENYYTEQSQSGNTVNGTITAGNGGDAPNGGGATGAVFFVLSRKE